jgi:hypothetical protein
MANEIIENFWSIDSVDVISNDLKNLNKNDSGFELAKELEGYYFDGDYVFDTSFIEWLDDLGYEYDKLINENVEAWVNAHNIKPKYSIGTKLLIDKMFVHCCEFGQGDEVFINGINERLGKYHIFNIKDSKRNYVVNYEKVEESTTKI